MRILHLDAGREMRGGQWQVLRLIAGLAAEGVESTLLARPGAPLWHAVCSQGWRVERLAWLRAARLAAGHDLVHAHDAHSHTIAALLPGVQVIVSRRVAFAVKTGLASQWKYRRAVRFIAVSKYVKSILMQARVPGEKISVVYDGVPLIEPAEQTAGIRVLAPANLRDPEKGARLAIESARIAGVDLDFSADLERDLPHATLLLYVSHTEGLGSGALLAMAAGVPVVASRVGGLPEVIQHGVNGILVENRPEAFAAAVRQVLDDPEWARRLGAAGRQTVAERFTANEMVHRTIEVYRQVLRA